MLAALREDIGMGSAAAALQLPSSGSKISVESVYVRADPVVPPATRNIFISF